jgi:uncharacterized protein
LLVEIGGDRIGIEIKRTDQPRITPSIRRALEDIELTRVLVVHAGDRRFPLAPRVEAVPARELLTRGFES